jgi:hypothetical protein
MAEGPRTVLEDAGYRVEVRREQWTEVLVQGHGETWLGAGHDESSALEHALRQMCPSELARRALTPSSPAPRVLEQTAEVRTELSRPPPLVRREEPGLRTREQSLAELQVLKSRVRDSREVLAQCSAERQRLAMMAWICEARGHTEAFPEDAAIKDEVAAISRTLTDFGKAYWPGSVTALQLHMQPRDLPRHMLGGSAPTWRRAAELAEHALAQQVAADAARGWDAYGYADADRASPRPADPDRWLADLVQSLEAAGGPLDRGAEPSLNADETPRLEDFTRWVRIARWLRLATAEIEPWARIIGRLRWYASRRRTALQVGADELEASFRPDRAWAKVLGAEDAAGTGAAAAADPVADDALADRWKGKRLVLVGSRRDPEVQRSLSRALPGSELEWRVAEPRLLPEIVPLIESRRFDAVLAALGLQASASDHALATACGRADVPYLRVHHGEVRACLRALSSADAG